MNGFEKRKERKKQAILHTALRLFSESGVQKVSIKEIAAKAQVSQVTIYNYFGGKDELLFEAVQMFIKDQTEQFRATVQNTDQSFRDKIHKLLQDKKENMLHLHQDFLQAVTGSHPELKDWVDRFTARETIPILTELIEQGKAEGSVRASLSFQSILLYIDMYYKALRTNADFFTASPESLSEEWSDLFFYGLAGMDKDHL
ncbi:UNVERIFIED_CONTAM: TetR/AcrR family transcriptional regulator [Halobacillus marinus]|uniref:TetR/AcrR family transcriptional regulator n=1 Tax=Bacillaceae TaxID=186817 RepID=UPI0002A4DF9B|nr:MULTISPECIES: TetR/AcrR family transcriptional regulator [Bacillaceae]ELK47599.1 TetR family transcriptional regulator [Halobacillus sp. BAB-2008]QHT45915.1 TetR/AcrR family transcriptional regulator [Bacillus sp. SB49]